MTGAWDWFSAAFMVATDTWARSMRTPSRFSSLTTLCGDTGLRGQERQTPVGGMGQAGCTGCTFLAQASGAPRCPPDRSRQRKGIWAGPPVGQVSNTSLAGGWGHCGD